jgi:hypothetical protein
MIKLTSLLSFLETKDERKSHTQLLAEWIVAESNAGRPVWIRRIANVAARRHGMHSLMQISTASARLNTLKKEPFTVDGIEYHLVRMPSQKCIYSGKLAEMYRAMTRAEMEQYHNSIPFELKNDTNA